MDETKRCECGTPCWSGVWMETEGRGYMEIADADERFHRPPPGWTLESVNYNIFNSSQIFRYVPAPVEAKTPFLMGPSAAMAALTLTGVGVGFRPIVQALLTHVGMAA